MTAATIRATRNAAFAKALHTLMADQDRAMGNHSLKRRARNPAIGEKYRRDYDQAKANYRAAKRRAQEEYLAAFAALDNEWEAGL
jgi:hypothetical protein